MTLTNWAGNVRFGAAQVHRPQSVAELQEVVARADRLRVLGTGHSFNRIADSPGALVSVRALPPEITVDSAQGTVTVAAGVRYGDLVTGLQQAGYALPSMASLPHISVAGSCATGTHGSGDGIGNLATMVTALELVTADGELRRLDHAGQPDHFRAAVVGLGAFGVATRLTLRLVPAFQVRQYVYEQLPHRVLVERFDEVFGSAYSVSVFTDWAGEHAGQVWRKQREGADGGGAPQHWLGGARLADGPRHPVPGMAPTHCTDQLGALGPWHMRLPHFRLEFTPSNGEELQSEFFVARRDAPAAIEAIRRLRERVAPVLQISEIRTVAADDLWLSPCYQRDTVAFHFTWVADSQRVTPVVSALEEQLAPLAVRPHWGKLFTMPPEVLRGRYPRLPEAAALAAAADPTGKFRNEFVDRYLYSDSRLP